MGGLDQREICALAWLEGPGCGKQMGREAEGWLKEAINLKGCRMGCGGEGLWGWISQAVDCGVGGLNREASNPPGIQAQLCL